MKNEDIKNLENLPEILRRDGQFCLWKYETVDGRLTKVPYNPHKPQEHARVNAPATFSNFRVACGVAIRENVDGIGTRVTSDLTAVDIDHCINEAGELTPEARDIVDTLDAYTERSPGGDGLHVYFTAPRVEFDKKKYYIKHGGLEVYIDGQTNRYLTVTGRTVRPGDIVDRSEALQAVLNKYMVRTPENSKTTPGAREVAQNALELDERQIIDLATNARNGAKFNALYSGQWETYYNSQSEADGALCMMLAFYTEDEATIDSIFRSSGLYREKWDREDYRSATIQTALSKQVEHYKPTNSREVGAFAKLTDAVLDEMNPNDPGALDPITGEAENAPANLEPVTAPEDALDEFLAEIQTERFKPIPTGLKQLDEALEGGLVRKQLITLASAPGMGKTAISQYIFENMARNGHTVIYVNLEMDRSQLLSRSISRVAFEQWKSKYTSRKPDAITWAELAGRYDEITTTSIMRGYKWTDEQKAKIERAVKYYRENIAPRFYYVTTNPENSGHVTNKLSRILEKLEQITEAVKLAGEDEPLICIDYLQFIDYDLEPGTKKPDTAEAIKETLRAFKDFALQHNTVVWLIMANNRTSNQEGRASMDSGRDTSNIEYSGDVMLSLVYTAIEEKWLRVTSKKDRDGNTKKELIDLEFINDKIDYCRRVGNEDGPLIAKLQSLKVVKGRGMASRGVAKFIYNGKYSTFEEDNGIKNPYYEEDKDKDPEN